MVNTVYMTSGGDDTKAQLLTEARDLFLEVGLERCSLREVARRAKVSPAAVYRHFDDKNALFHDVCQMGLEIFYGYLVKALSAKTPRARLDACAHQYMRFGLENPRDYRFIFMNDLSGSPAGAVPEDRGPTFQFLKDRVRECMEAKIFQRADIEETAAMIWAHVHGLVSLRLSGQLALLSDAAFASFYERSTQKLIVGLG